MSKSGVISTSSRSVEYVGEIGHDSVVSSDLTVSADFALVTYMALYDSMS